MPKPTLAKRTFEIYTTVRRRTYIVFYRAYYSIAWKIVFYHIANVMANNYNVTCVGTNC